MDNISTFCLSCQDSARILPNRKASIDPRSLEALDLEEVGNPFLLETIQFLKHNVLVQN